MRSKRLTFASGRFDRLTHYMFRYPAKFHPPVVRALIETYSEKEHTILDPFCGSGTALVEAAVLGRSAIGVDIDPVAVFVSRVKTRRVVVPALRRTVEYVLSKLHALARPTSEYERRQFDDLTLSGFGQAVRRHKLEIPPIPNIFHWFRKYVLIDLSRLLATIDKLDAPKSHRDFLRLCFAACIRPASNADPVPVSGLEVTAYMKRIDAAGRVINPFALFDAKVRTALNDIESYCHSSSSHVDVHVKCADATKLARAVRTHIDAVITSPPYHNAVDYYRRHSLEMYWLRFVSSHDDKLKLLPHYIGRAQVQRGHEFLAEPELGSAVAVRWECILRRESPRRADAFKHYVVAMKRTFQDLARCMRNGTPAVFVLGKSSWNGAYIPTSRLFEELASPYFVVSERFWYPLKNRYMSYDRHNGANIDKEYVLVLRRR